MAEPAYVMHRPPPGDRALPELSRVVITAPARTIEGDEVPAGTEGTIVGVWDDGDAYDVEFACALGPATVSGRDVRPLPA